MNAIRILASLATTLVLALGAAPAQAALYVHNDPAGDVATTTCSDPTQADTCENSDAGEVTSGDITRIRIRHTDTEVRVRIKFADLTVERVRGQYLKFHTNEGINRTVQAVVRVGWRKPSAVSLLRPSGDIVACRGLAATYDLDADVIVFVVPRSCLSNPRWVRVAVGAYEVAAAPAGFTLDDAQNQGLGASGLAWSPRVRRG